MNERDAYEKGAQDAEEGFREDPPFSPLDENLVMAYRSGYLAGSPEFHENYQP